MTAALIILTLMSVPLAGIISRAYLKGKQLDAQAKQSDVARLVAANHELSRRVEVLESIATMDGADLVPRPVSGAMLPPGPSPLAQLSP